MPPSIESIFPKQFVEPVAILNIVGPRATIVRPRIVTIHPMEGRDRSSKLAQAHVPRRSIEARPARTFSTAIAVPSPLGKSL